MTMYPEILTPNDVEICRLECERQHATSPEQIAGMVAAYAVAKQFACGHQPADVTVERLLELEHELAGLIEPKHAGYRTGPAVFFGGGMAAPAHEISWRLVDWASDLVGTRLMPPLARYKEYEYLHPHGDGNGRNGLCTWSIDVLWEAGQWPLEPPPEVFGSDAQPIGNPEDWLW